MSAEGHKKALKTAAEASFGRFLSLRKRIEWRTETLFCWTKIRVKKSCIYQSFIPFFAAMKESIYRMYLTTYSAAVN